MITEQTELVSAGFVSRLSAFVVDIGLLAAGIGGSAWVIRNVDLLLRPTSRFDPAELLVLVAPVIAAVYYAGLWWLSGQTVGKRLLGLRVVRTTGGRVGLGRAVLRLVGYVLSALPLYLGFAWVLFDRQHRGWHDRLAGTLVVYDRSAKVSGPAAVRSRLSVSATGPMRVVPGGAVHTGS